MMLEAHPTWSEGASAMRLTLDRLPDEVSQQLIANMTGGLEMPQAVTARILEASEGNPLFVEQLVSMLIDRGLSGSVCRALDRGRGSRPARGATEHPCAPVGATRRA